MRSLDLTKSISIVAILLIASCVSKTTEKISPVPDSDISQFLGQWTITTGDGSSTFHTAWLDVRQEENYIDGDLMWIGGTINPVSYMYLAGDALYVGRFTNEVAKATNEAGEAVRSHIVSTWLQIKKDGDNIVGYYLRPKKNGIGLDSTSFTGIKMPETPTAPDLSAVKFGEPITLFNGIDLTGWTLVEQDKNNGWTAIDNTLLNDPVHKEDESSPVKYGNLKTEQEFEDFNIKIEVKVPAHSNSGIYLRGIYEVQISDNFGSDPSRTSMGSLFSRITPSENAQRPASEWQEYDITLCDRHLTVVLNGIKVIDNQVVEGPTGGALSSDVLAPGPIYLQGDHGKVSYRNIVLTPIIK